jgi:hypothetical protein
MPVNCGSRFRLWRRQPARRTFAIGERVRITYDPDFGAGATGTIIEVPEGLARAHEYVSGLVGPSVSLYWVRVDEPVVDPEGDSYSNLQLDSRYLEPI